MQPSCTCCLLFSFSLSNPLYSGFCPHLSTKTAPKGTNVNASADDKSILLVAQTRNLGGTFDLSFSNILHSICQKIILALPSKYAQNLIISYHLLCHHPVVSDCLTWSFYFQLAPLQTIQYSSQNDPFKYIRFIFQTLQ